MDDPKEPSNVDDLLKGLSRSKKKRSSRPILRMDSANDLYVLNAMKIARRKERLTKWGRSMTFRYKTFEKKFSLLDPNLTNKLKADVFKSIMRRVGAQSEKTLNELVIFLDPMKSGRVNYKNFLELIAPEVTRRSHDKEISEYALAKMSPVLARCPALLKSNPLREKKQHKETSVVEYVVFERGYFNYIINDENLTHTQKQVRKHSIKRNETSHDKTPFDRSTKAPKRF